MALTDKLTAIADAIRAKTGKSDSLTLDQMPTEIANITGGGGSSADVRYVTFTNPATGETFVKPVAVGDDCVDVVAKGLWAKPTQESTAQYDYAFANSWSAEPNGSSDANILNNITEDKTVYAVFTATLRYYTITWMDEDGSVLATEPWEYGKVPSHTPSKDGVVFDSWTPTPTEVTGDASYTAVWSTTIASGTWGTNIHWALTSNGTLKLSGTGSLNTTKDNYKTVPWRTYSDSIKAIIIDDGITSVTRSAFMNESVSGNPAYVNVTSVTIADSVSVIESYAFYMLPELVSLKLPANLITIGDYAFARGCVKLSALELPDTVTTIGEYAFWACESLTSVNIPNSVTALNRGAFYACTGLTSVTFENTNGWYMTDTLNETSGTAIDVTVPATNATNLVSTYRTYYWYRS